MKSGLIRYAHCEYRVGIQRENGVQWLDRVRPTLAIRPESIERTWTLPEGTLHELVVAAFNAPGGYMRYDLEGEPVTLVVEARSDLRWMWPYDSSALGGLKYGIDESTGAVHVSDSRNHYEVILGADRIPKDEIAGGFQSIRYDEDALVGVSVGNDVLYSARYGLGANNLRRCTSVTRVVVSRATTFLQSSAACSRDRTGFSPSRSIMCANS